MKSSFRIALSGFLFVACCSSERAPVVPAPEAPKPSEETHGKPQAPVAIAATIDGARARVRVRFEVAGTASVRAYGVRGAVVAGKGELLASRSVAAGEELSFDVELSATMPEKGAAESLLVIDVRGDFGAKVQSFTVAQGEAVKPETRTINGERVQLTP